VIYTTVQSPIGELLLLGDGEVVHGLYMQAGRKPVRIRAAWQRDDSALADAREQLAEYFAGERTSFDLPMQLNGSAFQRTVWHALTAIPYGQTISYGELARRIGRPDLARAVGTANGQNPIAVSVPCHRVIGSDGKLVGYGGGLENKRLLLDLEQGTVPLALQRGSSDRVERG
jgi:methylated-DNA-[protein]-cysteine S-methyltransferase